MRDYSQAIASAITALRHLAGQSGTVTGKYSSAHLWEISNRLMEMNDGPNRPVKLPVDLAKNIKDEGYYRAICDMMDCIRAAGGKMEGDE